jgi:hypothetical protein
MRHSQKRILYALVFALSAAGLWLASPSSAQRGSGAGGGPTASTLGGGAGVSAYALTGARIVTVSGPVIERGTVVVRDGLIAAVGASVATPPDARVIDGTGLTVYPGVIDASTTSAYRARRRRPAVGGPGRAADSPRSLRADRALGRLAQLDAASGPATRTHWPPTSSVRAAPR